MILWSTSKNSPLRRSVAATSPTVFSAHSMEADRTWAVVDGLFSKIITLTPLPLISVTTICDSCCITKTTLRLLQEQVPRCSAGSIR
jgi:hypothetical protein